MNDSILEKNISVWSMRNRVLAEKTLSTRSDNTYSCVKISKTGHSVPCSSDGFSYNSLYDPIREAQVLIDSIPGENFVFFAGIGGAFHIRDFLNRFPAAYCVIAEASFASMHSLLQVIDISDILGNHRVSVIPDCTDNLSLQMLTQLYLPAVHGNFRLVTLRSWVNKKQAEIVIIEQYIQKSLDRISSDYSVQAHFGRIWFRNFLLNIQLAGQYQGYMPRFDLQKTAIIVAAGPSLETQLNELRIFRNKYVVITTDTAFSTLIESGIQPDIFVSIDAQAISSNHVMHSFTREMSVFLDICGNTVIARKSVECGANLVFTAGSHPMALYASSFCKMPHMETSSGTVTLSALDAAYSLGFSKIRVLGADFAYTNGKPYSKGTYLASTFGKLSNKFITQELLYTELMFRTPVTKIKSNAGLTYSTETLERYALFYQNFISKNFWKPGNFHLFPSESFLVEYKKDIERIMYNFDINDSVSFTLYPFIAWVLNNKIREESRKDVKKAIQLALVLIARYNK